MSDDPLSKSEPAQDGRTLMGRGEEADAIERARRLLAAGVPTALRALEEVGADPEAHPAVRRAAERARAKARRRGAG